MAYASVEQLAAQLRVSVTTKNEAWLQQCLDAAAAEIDAWLARFDSDPLPDPAPALAVTSNVARAVEWFKASDAAFGGIGFPDTGVLPVPRDSFARHAATLIPLVQQFGIA